MKPLASLRASLKNQILIDGGDGEDDGLACQIWHEKTLLRIIASWGGGWDHVSISLPNRIPTWDEMCFVKDFFFLPSECAIQYHPPHNKYVNNNPHVLHIWRPQKEEIVMPPIHYV